jgi:hypothetical protein
MTSSNSAFRFGSGSGDSPCGSTFNCKAASINDKSFNISDDDRSQDYVAWTQYSLLEERYNDLVKHLDVLEAERAAEKISTDIIKNRASNMEKAYSDLVASSKADQIQIRTLEKSNNDLEKKFLIAKAALQNSQELYKASTVDLCRIQNKLDAAESELAIQIVAVDTLTMDLDLEMNKRLHEHKVQVESDLVAEYSENLYAAIDFVEAVTLDQAAEPVVTTDPPSIDHNELKYLHKQNLQLKLDYNDLLCKYQQLTNRINALWLGQTMGNRHLLVLFFFFCAWAASFLLSGNPAGLGALGYGGFDGDGWVTRSHASVLGALVDATGGVKVYL